MKSIISIDMINKLSKGDFISMDEFSSIKIYMGYCGTPPLVVPKDGDYSKVNPQCTNDVKMK